MKSLIVKIHSDKSIRDEDKPLALDRMGDNFQHCPRSYEAWILIVIGQQYQFEKNDAHTA